MPNYDPEQKPHASDWLALDEQARIDLAYQFHKKARIKMPSVKTHAAFHAVVENQIAESIEPVVRAMSRLQREGLSRHDALHAVATVMAEHLHEVMTTENGSSIANESYFAAVERLTAQGWLNG
jgi:hypothetical protein